MCWYIPGQIPCEFITDFTHSQDNYVEITTDGATIIPCSESRRLLNQIGIAREILPTPGHSDHCVSLLLVNGSVFTGDLPPEEISFDNSPANPIPRQPTHSTHPGQ